MLNFSQFNMFSLSKPKFNESDNTNLQTESEQRQNAMKILLENQFSPTHLNIKDVSGGCGAFYHILIVSDKFAGKLTLARHRQVQTTLKDIIPEMHGLTLFTYTTQQYDKLQQESKNSDAI